MLQAEAVRIREILLGAGRVSPLLDLGSSTRGFREAVQPHVERELFGPLREAGVTIFHCDRKSGDGVDYVGDPSDAAVRRDLAAMGFGCVLLSNLLEHVGDREALAAACEEIAGPGRLILATCPSSYPYHADPIDTGFRPTPQALALLFERSETVLAEEIVGPNYREAMRAEGIGVAVELARTLSWALAALVRPKSFAARAHRWLWYSRPYRVALVLVRVC
jgi:hypothetical protein